MGTRNRLQKILAILMSVILLVTFTTIATPVMAGTQPQVTIAAGENIIGYYAHYTISFTAFVALDDLDRINVYFPEGTGIISIDTEDVIVDASVGTGGGGGGPMHPRGVNAWSPSGTPYVLLIDLAENQTVGSGSQVVIEIYGVLNPDTPGTYTLGVASQVYGGGIIESFPDSAPYTINIHDITPLPGVVLGFNSAGILMKQSISINECIIAAGPGGRIEVGPGWYDEAVNANVAGQTIIGTGQPGTVIIQDMNDDGAGGTVTINNAHVTLDNLQIKPGSAIPQPTMVTVAAGADSALVKDSRIISGNISAVTSNTGADNVTVSGCNILCTPSKTGIVAGSDTHVTHCTFNGTPGSGDIGISASGMYISARNNSFKFCSVAVDAESCSNTWISANKIIDSETGIKLVNSGSNRVYNNILIRSVFHGIYISASSSENELINNTIVDGYGYGIYAEAGASGNAVVNSIFWDNGIDLGGVTALWSDISDGDAGEGNISVDPEFVDPASDDYHLQTISPCIDTGNNSASYVLGIDIDYDMRIYDGDGNGTATVDMGADEYTPGPMTSPLADIDFHGVELGSSLDLTTTITNTSPVSLTINSIIRAEGSNEFTYIGPATPFDILPYTSRDIIVRYTPAAEMPAEAVFNINTTDPLYPDTTFNTCGYGVIILGGGSGGLLGDVNGDGNVNVLDMTKIARIILGLD